MSDTGSMPRRNPETLPVSEDVLVAFDDLLERDPGVAEWFYAAARAAAEKPQIERHLFHPEGTAVWREVSVLAAIVHASILPPVGLRVRLVEDVDRYPHFLARRGLTGTVTESDTDGIAVLMDDHLPGAVEWDNQIMWHGDTAQLFDFGDDTFSAVARKFLKKVEQELLDLRKKWAGWRTNAGADQVIIDTALSGFAADSVQMYEDGGNWDLVRGPYELNDLADKPLTRGELSVLTEMPGAIIEYHDSGAQYVTIHERPDTLQAAWAALEEEAGLLQAERDEEDGDPEERDDDPDEDRTP